MHEIYLRSKNYEPLLIIAGDSHSNILGVLLAVIQKEHPGLLGNFSARSIILAGPLIENNSLYVLEYILKEYKKKIKNKAIYTQVRNLWTWSDNEKAIFLKNGFNYEEHLDILVDLKKAESILISEMHQGRRKNIGRASRIPLEFSETENIIEFQKCLTLIGQTYRRIKLPYPDNSFFISADKILREKSYIRKFVVKYNSEIIGCRFILCYKGLVYDWFAGADEKHLDKYPNDFLPWKIIQWSKMKGYDTFDFGGAGNPYEAYGVRDFKLKFGGQLVNFGRFGMVHNNLRLNFAKIGLKLYQLIKY